MDGLKDTYDFAFSMGAACACSMALRRAGMQYASFPFDWLVNYPSVKFAAELLVNGFEGLLRRERMVYHCPNPDNDKDIYQNEENGIYFLHDFPKGGDFNREYPAVEEKYRRRARRLVRQMERSRRVLMVYVTVPDSRLGDVSDFRAAWEIVSARYPEAEIDFLVFVQNDGVSFSESCLDRPHEHLHLCSFDYRSRETERTNVSDDRCIASALNRLVNGVCDYRTSDERRRYRAVRRQKVFDLYRAASTWELLRNKACYKLMRHFQNKLERKGFSLG